MLAHDYGGDSPTDRVLAALRARGNKPRRSGANWSARCPAHDDRNASLSVRAGDDGRALLKCHAGCEVDAVAHALGMAPSDLFVPRSRPSDNDQRTRKREPLTLAELALAKCLPVEHLEGLGWRDAGGHVEIPYITRDGKVHRTRLRTAISAKDGSRWANDGEGQIAYQPDGGAMAYAQQRVVIVEGETDTATLLHAGIAALGIPGASATNLIECHHIQDVRRVYYVREPDRGGEAFAEGVPARLRELGYTGAVSELRMPDGAKDPNALWCRDPNRERFGEALRALMAGKDEAPQRRTSLADYAATLRPEGTRLSTGIATLDGCTRGGIPRGKVIVANGAPGAAKTTLAAQLMHLWEQAGATVCWLAADEPAEGVATRIGQQMAFSREGLEDAGHVGEHTRAEFARVAEGRRIILLDPDEDGTTIEAAAEHLRAQAGDTTPVLIVDSLQTARCSAAAEATSLREEVNAKVAALKTIARQGVLVVAISEMSRAGYRGGAEGNISALAAGKESGAIEYGAALLLGLRSVKGETGQVDVEVAKNRLGPSKPTFRLLIDFARASMSEIPCPEGADPDAARRERLGKLRANILDAVRTGNLTSARSIYREVGGTQADVFAEVKDMLVDGQLRKVGGVIRVGRVGAVDET